MKPLDTMTVAELHAEAARIAGVRNRRNPRVQDTPHGLALLERQRAVYDAIQRRRRAA